MTDTFLNRRELTISIIQGLVITLGILSVYQLTAHSGEEKTRAMVFATLIFSNILLSLVNRSFFYSMFESFRNKNFLLVAITAITMVMLFAILYINPFSRFFKVTILNMREMGTAFGVAAVSVLWFEVYKWIKRMRRKQPA